MAPRLSSKALLWAFAATYHLLLGSTVSAYTYPDPRYEALENLLYADDLSRQVADCPRRLFRGELAGSNVAAEWLRFAYHDVATHNVETGLGGLDSSMFYDAELARPENVGFGLGQTVADYKRLTSKLVTRSDIIAIGVVLGVAACGGPVIPFRGGRVDTRGPGPSGVPEPHQDIESHIHAFALQGFNQTEMIGLVACGHTIGGVQSQDFPGTVHPPAPGTDVDGNGVVVFFDADRETEKDVFDEKVVTRYLDGTTKNPLVTGHNSTTNSDLRIFMSDGNSTMRSMSTKEPFNERCKTLLGKMIETVPRGTEFTEEIRILDVKVAETKFHLINETMFLYTGVRVTFSQGNGIKPIEYEGLLVRQIRSQKDCQGGSKRCASEAPEWGQKPVIEPSVLTKLAKLEFDNYLFLAPIRIAESVSKFWFEADNGSKKFDNGGQGYGMPQDKVFMAQYLSTTQSNFPISFEDTFYPAIAIHESLKPTQVIGGYFDNTNKVEWEEGTFNLALNTTLQPQHGYNFYTGTAKPSGGTGLVFDFFVDFEDGSKISLLDERKDFGLFPEPPVSLSEELPL